MLNLNTLTRGDIIEVVEEFEVNYNGYLKYVGERYPIGTKFMFDSQTHGDMQVHLIHNNQVITNWCYLSFRRRENQLNLITE